MNSTTFARVTLIAGGGLAVLLAALLRLNESSVAAPTCGIAVTDAPDDGMVLIPGGRFRMGADGIYLEEGPPVIRTVSSFYMSRHDVTNAQFSRFVRETGYRTVAERSETGAAVFVMPDTNDTSTPLRWWQMVPGANWRHPDGPGSNLMGRERHPVVQIAYEDAEAYAVWAGLQLPTESQWEFAARGGKHDHSATTERRTANSDELTANTWQGIFPFINSKADGFVGTSPVGCYSANGYGLYDMLGNVWEWTTDVYSPRHEQPGEHQGFDPNNPGLPSRVIKGGSFLCASDVCMRYRPSARQPHDEGLGTSHIGFRVIRSEPLRQVGAATPNIASVPDALSGP